MEEVEQSSYCISWDNLIPMCPLLLNIREKGDVTLFMRCFSSFGHCVSVDIVCLAAKEVVHMPNKLTMFYNAITPNYHVSIYQPIFSHIRVLVQMCLTVLLAFYFTDVILFHHQLLLYCQAVMHCVWERGLCCTFLVVQTQVLKLENFLHRLVSQKFHLDLASLTLTILLFNIGLLKFSILATYNLLFIIGVGI